MRRLALALGLSFASGFVALSYEILWFRVYSFATAGRAWAFGIMLGAYLLGIAAGSAAARSYCEGADGEGPALRVFAYVVLASNVLAYFMIPLYALFVGASGGGEAFPLIVLVVPLLGVAFPLLCHFAVPADERAGARVSYLYLANILGSAAGSLGTGFVLADVWSLPRMATFIALVGLAVSAGAVWLARPQRRQLAALLAATAVGAGVTLAATPALFDLVYERLQTKTLHPEPFAHIVENRSGVITVTSNGTVFGGGVYDGAFNTSPADERNQIIRAYGIALLHPAPKRVLMIGLSSGSWAQVIAQHPALEQLTIVEINPGYLDLIPKYPMVASLQHNPKVHIIIDDGRRWLVRHEGRFDVIVANATFHWRSHATALLSTEWLELIRRHLNPGGLYYFNPTGSLPAVWTAATAFPYANFIGNSVVVSDSPIEFDQPRAEKLLAEYRLDGQLVVDPSLPSYREVLDKYIRKARPVSSRKALLSMTEEPQIITDDNMLSEWE
jgi:spermidine synthase